MAYCKRMKRPCTCGRLSVYDRNGRLVEPVDTTHCLTDSEVSAALAILLQEWQVRFGDANAPLPSLQLPLQ